MKRQSAAATLDAPALSPKPIDTAENAALDVLADIDGARAFDLLADDIERMDVDRERLLHDAWPPFQGERVVERFRSILEPLKRREVLARRLAGLGRRLGRPWPESLPRTVDVGELVRRLHEKMVSEIGQPYLDQLRLALDSEYSRVTASLQNVALGMQLPAAVRETPLCGFGTVDRFLTTMADHARKKAALEGRLAVMAREREFRDTTRRETVAAVFEAVGGGDAVAEAVKEALSIAGTYFAGDEASPPLQELEARLAVLRSQVAEMEALPHPPVVAIGRLKDEAGQHEGDITALRTQIDGRKREAIRADVEAALAGDADAQARIADAARAAPVAFPSSFAVRLTTVGADTTLRSALTWVALLAYDEAVKG